MSSDFDVAPYGGTCNQVQIEKKQPPLPKSHEKITREQHIQELEDKRTILSADRIFPNDNNMPKYIIGFFTYIILFVIIIPYLMIKNKVPSEFILAYMPNVDILATILGYDGGPTTYNALRYLYNPSNFTVYGFINATVINYLALLGVTYVIARETHEKRSWEYGWAAAFICLFMTYLAPGNPIVIAQNNFETFLSKYGINDKHARPRYILMTMIGLAMATILILCEAMVIRVTRPHIINIIKQVSNWLK